jgi:asparagine synthase (glutamine-hydrolysing)
MGLGDQSHAAMCTNQLIPRGPEGTRLHKGVVHTSRETPYALGFTRLAINGLSAQGMQPFHILDKEGKPYLSWICNGEIYNHAALEKEHGFKCQSGSDCEVIGHLYDKMLIHTAGLQTMMRALDGVFAFVLVDHRRGITLIGRDPYGVRPLFYGQNEYRTMTCFASEMKAFPTCLAQLPEIKAFPPGHFAILDHNHIPPTSLLFQVYHYAPFLKSPVLAQRHLAEQAVREALIEAVEKRVLNTERPIAALLSGGVDSSLIAALVQRSLQAKGKPALQTFSIGFEGSEDLRHARMVAEHIKSDHHEIVSTPDEFFAAIPEVVAAIESYDLTTVRASVGNYLVSKYIRANSGAKVVFNGDGSDEVFGSYLYFYRAPTDTEYEAEITRLLTDIHLYDVLRSDRSISSNGLEPRTPFLDRQFVGVARSVPTHLLRPHQGKQVEKQLLRDAFAAEDGTSILPYDVLYRKKEAFSDGVSNKEKSWFEEIQERVAPLVPEDWKTYGDTKEQAYYRILFNKTHAAKALGQAPNPNCKYRWLPKWSGETTDPSARTLSLYNNVSKA